MARTEDLRALAKYIDAQDYDGFHLDNGNPLQTADTCLCDNFFSFDGEDPVPCPVHDGV